MVETACLEEPRSPGRQVGPYRLLDLLGEGAMGQVYRAEHVLMGRAVALKVLRPELAKHTEAVRHFFDEARAVNMTHSEHIVDITDLCFDPSGDTFLVMELLDGETLSAHSERLSLSLLRSLRIVRQLCEALIAVHEVGVVHRDLKPDNVIVMRRGGTDHVKLLDFGIAKLSRAGLEGQADAETGLIVGTPQYMAPEQATAGHIDHRTDLHALGTILFELVTGRLPFEEPSLEGVLRQIARSPAPRVSAYVRLPAEVHKPLEDLLVKCLEKDPARRPQSAKEVRDTIDALIDTLRASARDGAWIRPAKAVEALRLRHQLLTLVTTTLTCTRIQTTLKLRFRKGWRSSYSGWLTAAVLLALVLAGLRAL